MEALSAALLKRGLWHMGAKSTAAARPEASGLRGLIAPPMGAAERPTSLLSLALMRSVRG